MTLPVPALPPTGMTVIFVASLPLNAPMTGSVALSLSTATLYTYTSGLKAMGSPFTAMEATSGS